MRDGRFIVYEGGDWVGTVGQLPHGSWIFVPRLSGDGICSAGMTMEGAVSIWKSTRSSTKKVEGLEENENGIFIAAGG